MVKLVGKDCEGLDKQNQTVSCNKKKCGRREGGGRRRGRGREWGGGGRYGAGEGRVVKLVGKDCGGVDKQNQTVNCNNKKCGGRRGGGGGVCVWGGGGDWLNLLQGLDGVDNQNESPAKIRGRTQRGKGRGGLAA